MLFGVFFAIRIDTNDAKKALESGKLFVRGKGGLTRYVPINKPIRIILKDMLKVTPLIPQKRVYN